MLTSAAMVPATTAGPPEWYTTGQVARRLGLHPETIRRRIEDHKVPAWRIAEGCEWRIPKWWVEEQLERVRPFRRRS